MSPNQYRAALGQWEGYVVDRIHRREPGQDQPHPQVLIELVPYRHHRPLCAGCGQVSRQVHETRVRLIRDLPLFDADTWLLVHRRRVRCDRCGPQLEKLSWLARYSRVTGRLAEAVARLCQVLPVKHVASFFHLSWDQVKAIDKAYLKETLGEVDLSGVEAVAMDEFAIQKGHRYATVFVEPSSKRVLWVCRGRDRKSVRPFFEMLGPEGRERLKAVVMDMNSAYEEEVRSQCPHVEIIYDLFHVVAKYGREVIDRVRVDEANRWRSDKKTRKVIKSARWLLLRNRENVKQPQDRIRLQELLAANRRLFTVYVLKEDLKRLWRYRSPWAAAQAWKHWYGRAIRSRIEPLKRFAKRLKNYLPGIVAHCRWPLHTSLLEGINNKIKVIKRMAYGFRDDDYFFLKIRAAFPGNAG